MCGNTGRICIFCPNGRLFPGIVSILNTFFGGRNMKKKLALALILALSIALLALPGGIAFADGDNTLTVYIGKLRNKLGQDAIKTVKGIGYKMEYI